MHATYRLRDHGSLACAGRSWRGDVTYESWDPDEIAWLKGRPEFDVVIHNALPSPVAAAPTIPALTAPEPPQPLLEALDEGVPIEEEEEESGSDVTEPVAARRRGRPRIR